ncbi:MAG: NADH-quinone oxidoreductase subunit J [Calditrichaeota bacterium]|nr:NADH-quinone oxidoreductase subunit J [Calditrichota bacterium]MCB9391141.1 NADH-quinone oxidoreductase subunit J [Calditrichota bacterium]
MGLETILFLVLAFGSVLTALLVVTSPSPIGSALYLVVTMFSLAGLYVLLAAPFLAAIQIIVYAGAIIVLLLFVIMLLNLQRIEERLPRFWRVAGLSVAGLTLLVLFMAIIRGSSVLPDMPAVPDQFGKVKSLGGLLFSKYLFAFEATSVLLLAAMIGAVALVRKADEGKDGR